MHDELDNRSPAQAELRRRLDEGRASARLDQTQLARNAGLGRSTVSKALSLRGGVPSVDTVTALAHALHLPVGELLELRRTAVQEMAAVSVDLPGPGRPIGQWEPHDLEVHPAGPGAGLAGAGRKRALSGYVRRAHDLVLIDAVAAAVAGNSGIVVLEGTSSTGKTRACWQAVQPLAGKGWRLWHPFYPTHAQAALEDLHRVGPRTVVWLNEAQHYLGDRTFGEQIAAAVHQLLIDDTRGPVLVLGTLWPEYAHTYTALPAPGGDDPYSRVRELLAGHTVNVPDTFDAAALATATDLADKGDALLADALTRARDSGRITQDLAGAPELLRRYEQPRHPAARALLEAAMDARRLGVGLHLPQAFLTDAAPDYLSDHDYDQLSDNWAEQAYAELAEQVHGKQAPLRRTTPRPPRRPPTPTTTDASTAVPPPTGPVFRLADYLEQHGRTTRRHLCPPAAFWNSAHTHLTHPDDLISLARAAEDRHRLQWSYHLHHRAADHGSTGALVHLAKLRERAGDQDGAELLARQAADQGDTDALVHLAELREETGDQDSAESLARQAADHGDSRALYYLAVLREGNGDRDGAETLHRQAADYGFPPARVHVVEMSERAGDRDGAETVAGEAADHGDTGVRIRLAVLRQGTGDRDSAEPLARVRLALLREGARDRDSAETVAREVADHRSPDALFHLALLREQAGDLDSAETLAREAADQGFPIALYLLVELRERAGDRDGAELLAQQAAGRGDTSALVRLVELRERAGDRDGAELLARQAADHGALVRLAELREETGDRESAESLARQAADHGATGARYRLTNTGALNRLWPYGLDPDGAPTSPWQQSVSVEQNRHAPPSTS
ncbi:helix-turn-helix domain-containing protein [Streptomyces sp. NPDC057020]|uniref:helix-turn-helix domain-containing protein n=1 Tax=unclassified Streptomyces TaxID=2593676 RepID=UPI00363ADDA1